MKYLSSMIGREALIALFITLMTVCGAYAQEEIPQVDRPAIFETKKESVAAPVLAITPITWGVIGLDSNNVSVGPNVFPVGARLCNNGDAPATNVASTFVWDSVNALIDFRSGSNTSINLSSLAAGACTDLYYEVAVTRSSSAYNTTRRFHITATADGLGVSSTPTPRELYVEKLVSQNRNSVTGIKLNGVNVPFGGHMSLTVGNTYTIQLIGSTATNGYEQIESFINLPNVVFQVLSVATTYTAPTGFAGNKLYEDACSWDPVPTSGTYRSCFATGKVGGDVTLAYTVKILSGGGTSQTLNTLIYDFSGSSYHYNSDFSSSAVIADIINPTLAADLTVSGRVQAADGRGIANARVTMFEANGSMRTVLTGKRGYFEFAEVEGGQTVMVSVTSRRFTFSNPVKVIDLVDNVADLDFVAEAP